MRQENSDLNVLEPEEYTTKNSQISRVKCKNRKNSMRIQTLLLNQ